RHRAVARHAEDDPAGSPYRLRLLGDRRGIRTADLRSRGSAVPGDRGARAGTPGRGGKLVRGARSGRAGFAVCGAGVREHPGQPAAVPVQGADPAADQLWRIIHHSAVLPCRAVARDHPAQPLSQPRAVCLAQRDGQAAREHGAWCSRWAGDKMSVVARHYVLAAGGTGGHLTPAFALAHELDRRGHHVALITDARGAEIPGKPDFLPAHVLPAGRFGKNPLHWPKALAAVLEGRSMSMRLYGSFAPSAVVGFGGYPALPALLGARAVGVPAVIHEQNAVLGRVNRLLAGSVAAIATAYPAVDRLPAKHARKVH